MVRSGTIAEVRAVCLMRLSGTVRAAQAAQGMNGVSDATEAVRRSVSPAPHRLWAAIRISGHPDILRQDGCIQVCPCGEDATTHLCGIRVLVQCGLRCRSHPHPCVRSCAS